MLVRLLYASRAAKALTPDVIESILASSRKTFMQVLEGGRDTVNHLYSRICSDSRHRDVIVLHYEEITERRFSNWTMGQVNLDRVNPSILLKYSERPVLDPYAVSGKVSMALLDELLATASIISRSN